MEIMEFCDLNMVYVLVLAILYDICHQNYLINSISVFNYQTSFILINIIGLYLFLKCFKIRVRFNLNVDLHY